MIFTTNPDGNILDMNWAGIELLGYKTKRNCWKRVKAEDLYRDPADRDKFLARIMRRALSKITRLNLKNVTALRCMFSYSSRKYENSKTGAIEIEGIIKDISQRKQNEDIISQRNRELSIINQYRQWL